MRVAASLWSADLSNVAGDMARVEPYVDEFHLDVADGRYAPLLLFFPDMVAAIRRRTTRPLEVHLITWEPEKWLAPFADAGANIIVIYPDATDDLPAVLRDISARGLRCGVSLAPGHPVDLVLPVLQELDRVVVMGTDVGMRGVDAPLPATYEKIRRLVSLRSQCDLSFTIEADGAIRRGTVPLLRQAGADTVVPGSLIFNDDAQKVGPWLQML